MLNKILDLLGCKVNEPSVLDRFYENYYEEQRLMNIRSVYTASSRPLKPGVRG